MPTSKKPSGAILSPMERNRLASKPTQTPKQSAQVLEQPVEFVQSLELVQTLVCAVMSTVASLRSIFPDDCFMIRHFDIENPNSSYRDFIEYANEGQTTGRNPGGRRDHKYIPWEILLRGTNNGVNKMLDWIELGVADALSHKYLKTLQLGIYDGHVCGSKMVEAYVMTFSYGGDGISMELELSGGLRPLSRPSKTLVNAKQELRYLVHRLTNHIGGFPELPSESIVQIHFTYNHSCPPAYQPPGHVSSDDHELIVSNERGAIVGSINPGPHCVNLKVFVNEHNSEIPHRPKPSLVITLRNLNKTLDPGNSTLTDLMEADITEEAIPVSEKQILTTETIAVDEIVLQTSTNSRTLEREANLDQHQHASAFSVGSSGPNTQEKMQIDAIATMAHLRSSGEDLRETQVLDMNLSKASSRYVSVDLDGDSSAMDGSSTQGTPSSSGGLYCSSRQLTSRSATKSPSGEAFIRLRPRKRQSTPSVREHTELLSKVSKARSPFVTARLRK